MKEQIARDLALLQRFVSLVEWVWDAPWLQLSANVYNFAARFASPPHSCVIIQSPRLPFSHTPFRMNAQCNLAVEAGNLVHFKQNFGDAQSIRFPTPVEGFYHPLVLVESFEGGVHIER